MGAAEEDLTEPSALEECCCGPMFLREPRGLSKQLKKSFLFDLLLQKSPFYIRNDDILLDGFLFCLRVEIQQLGFTRIEHDFSD